VTALSPSPSSAARPSAAQAARRHVRNLVCVRAGAQSLHGQWIAADRRDFDLFVSDYGGSPGRWRDAGSEYYELRLGPKWPCLHALLDEHAWLLDEYDAFWFPDDDLAADTATIDRMFAFFHAHELALAQPALTRNSFYTWNTLLQQRDSLLRLGNFVEVMAPIFSRSALRLCAPTFSESQSGWGLDWLWPALLQRENIGPIAVIDATPVRHTRRVGGELYRNHPTMDPRADAERVLLKYGLREVRAVAKYSTVQRVQLRPLPLAMRLSFWFKRLNGKRKHLFAR
jgi:hypothetical protein